MFPRKLVVKSWLCSCGSGIGHDWTVGPKQVLETHGPKTSWVKISWAKIGVEYRDIYTQ